MSGDVHADRASRRHLIALLAAAPLAAVLSAFASACSRPGGQTQGQPVPAASPAPSAAPPSEERVRMTASLRFDPAEISVAPGTVVTWTNESAIPHTATDDPRLAVDTAHAALPSGVASWDSGLLQPGESWSHRFEVSGHYTYFCVPHETAGMVGRVTVQT